MADEQNPSAASPSAASPAPGSPAPPAQPTWWQRNHRRFWLWLAFVAAVTAPLWGGLILLLLFSPSSPFPKG